MGSWGGLNPALTAWREAVNALFPLRGRQSDGGYADQLHGSRSEHQPDPDGTVDAFDEDVNYLGSPVPTGSPLERRIREALHADFQGDPHGRAQLWISEGQIANADIGDWKRRPYTLANRHDHHTHRQSRQSRERDGRPWPLPCTEALLREIRGEDDEMDAKERAALVADTAAAAAAATVKALLAANVSPPDQKSMSLRWAVWQTHHRSGNIGNVQLPAVQRALMAAGVSGAELAAALREIPTADENAQAVIDALAAGSPEATAAALRVVLGAQAGTVGRLLAEGAPAGK